MKKPKYLSDAAWEAINRPENAYYRFQFGFAEFGDKTEFTAINGLKFSATFYGTFRTRKAAKQIRDLNYPNAKIYPYIHGRFKDGWSVIEITQIN